MVIRNPCGAKHRPTPPGVGKRTDCHVGLCPPRNDSGGRYLPASNLVRSVTITSVIARAVRPVAIRNPCGAKHRPTPGGVGKRTDCHVGLCPPRNDSGGRYLPASNLVRSVTITSVIARAVRPVAIRNPCGAKHRPTPGGVGKRTDCHVGLCPPRNDSGRWCLSAVNPSAPAFR